VLTEEDISKLQKKSQQQATELLEHFVEKKLTLAKKIQAQN
jgi:hypothetical protein